MQLRSSKNSPIHCLRAISSETLKLVPATTLKLPECYRKAARHMARKVTPENLAICSPKVAQQLSLSFSGSRMRPTLDRNGTSAETG